MTVPAAGVGLAVLAAVGLAGQAMAIRVATDRGRTADALLVVLLVNAAVLVPLAWLRTSGPVSPTALAAFAGAGLTGTLVGRGLLYAGIDRVGASRAEPIKASTPLHATVLAVLLLGEPVSALAWAGVLLVVAGVALVSWESAQAEHVDGEAVPWVGLALPFAAAFLFGVEPVLAEVGFAAGTGVAVGLAVKTVAATTVYVAYLGWRGAVPSVGVLREGPLRWYLLAGLVNTGFLLAYYGGLAVSEVSVVVPIMQTSPLLVALGSAAFLRRLERVTPRLVAGAGVVVAGAVTVTLAG